MLLPLYALPLPADAVTQLASDAPTTFRIRADHGNPDIAGMALLLKIKSSSAPLGGGALVELVAGGEVIL